MEWEQQENSILVEDIQGEGIVSHLVPEHNDCLQLFQERSCEVGKFMDS